jgi:hypothetical protein
MDKNILIEDNNTNNTIININLSIVSATVSTGQACG